MRGRGAGAVAEDVARRGHQRALPCDDVACGDLGGQQIVHSLTDTRTGIAQKLDPSGSVDQNHEFR